MYLSDLRRWCHEHVNLKSFVDQTVESRDNRQQTVAEVFKVLFFQEIVFHGMLGYRVERSLKGNVQSRPQLISHSRDCASPTRRNSHMRDSASSARLRDRVVQKICPPAEKEIGVHYLGNKERERGRSFSASLSLYYTNSERRFLSQRADRFSKQIFPSVLPNPQNLAYASLCAWDSHNFASERLIVAGTVHHWSCTKFLEFQIQSDDLWSDMMTIQSRFKSRYARQATPPNGQGSGLFGLPMRDAPPPSTVGPVCSKLIWYFSIPKNARAK